MSSSFWLLGVESHDFYQAEKERTACKAEQIQKMTTIFTQKPLLILLYSVQPKMLKDFSVLFFYLACTRV